jgi:hypothetical protein
VVFVEVWHFHRKDVREYFLMTTKKKKGNLHPKKLNLRPVNHVGGSPGSQGLGPNYNGALNSPALNPGVREQ